MQTTSKYIDKLIVLEILQEKKKKKKDDKLYVNQKFLAILAKE